MALTNLLVTASCTLFHRLVSLFYFKVPWGPVAIHSPPVCGLSFLFTILWVEFTCFCLGNQYCLKHAWILVSGFWLPLQEV